ncbi:N-acetylmuramoyl-L-alanine amidase [Desulfovirgula thermocuniculi]|uniref:N-acetylmuramoyl-L-alanine amidase n=1 Tax=Desulfovirgula thermocuniculi TaxID=348842 RepID=UPI00040C2F98|nr:N-acetylmuramoyl-L-alanine amidase [Desulfovirgula thermocuniculi]
MPGWKSCLAWCRRLAGWLAAGLLFLSLAGKAPGAESSPIPEVVFKIGANTYTVNGQPFSMDASPFIAGNRAFVPVRYLALSLGVPPEGIGWDGQRGTVTLQKGGVTLKLTLGKATLEANGQAKPMDVAPLLKDNRVYLPARYVAQELGYRVDWQAPAVRITPDVLPVPENTQVTVQGDRVNVRSGPGTNYTVLAQVNKGERLAVLGKVPDWYQVKLPGGEVGWIVAWYVAPWEETSRGSPPESGQGGAPEDSSSGKQEQPGGAPAGPAVNSLEVSAAEKAVKVKITAGAPVDYRVFRLSSPERLVVDLTGVQPGEVPREVQLNSRVAGRLRVGWFSRSPDVTRLVFDLSDRAAWRARLSADKKTLELEVFVPDARELLRGKIIVVDPGHGGPDPGAMANGLKEKDLTLKIGQRLAGLLAAQGAKALMTRTNDSDVDLYARTDMANRAGADLFVSVHINANPSPDVQGTATYIPRREEAEARRYEESRRLAECIQSYLVRNLSLEDDGVREASFVVVRTASMPAVLVEVAYITNPREAGLLKQDAFLARAAEAIYQGIVDYLASR